MRGVTEMFSQERRGGERKRKWVIGQRNEGLEGEIKGEGRQTDSRRMTERGRQRDGQRHITQRNRKPWQSSFKRMKNDTLKSPNWEPEGIQGMLWHFIFQLLVVWGEKKKQKSWSISWQEHHRKTVFPSFFHLKYSYCCISFHSFYSAEVLAWPSQADWHTSGVDGLFRQ